MDWGLILMVDSTSKFPSGIDKRTFFQNASLKDVEVMKQYQLLFSKGKYAEASELLNNTNGKFYLGSWFMNLLENRLYNIGDYLLEKEKVCGAIHQDTEIRSSQYNVFKARSYPTCWVGGYDGNWKDVIYKDDSGNDYYIDPDNDIAYKKNGEYYYKAKDGSIYYKDSKLRTCYKDTDGSLFYMDDVHGKYWRLPNSDNPYQLDSGNKVWYLDDGSKYFYDDYENKYLINEEGLRYWDDYYLTILGLRYYIDVETNQRYVLLGENRIFIVLNDDGTYNLIDENVQDDEENIP